MSEKRENYLSWEDYFMSIAFLSGQRSKDPSTQVGACIVNKQNRIVGVGYNGMPNGSHDDKMPWNNGKDWINSKYPYVCHAELNSIMNRFNADLTGCTIYVSLYPCNNCAQLIVQSGITGVVYYSDKYHHVDSFKAARRIFEEVGITPRQHIPKDKKLVIDFEEINQPTQPSGATVTQPNADVSDGANAGQ